MKRKRLSRLQRTRVFDTHAGICCICGGSIGSKPWIVEHIVALEFGGADDESNMGPAHVEPCARTKTSAEWRRKTKADRQRAFHLGVKRRKTRPMPGTVASGIRKRFDGTVERR